MYLRHTTRRKDGKVPRYWQLVRSVRGGQDGGGAGARPPVRAVERAAHRRDVVSGVGAGGSARVTGAARERRSAVSSPGSPPRPQDGARAASRRAPWGAVRPGLRPAALRRDERVLRGAPHDGAALSRGDAEGGAPQVGPGARGGARLADSARGD